MSNERIYDFEANMNKEIRDLLMRQIDSIHGENGHLCPPIKETSVKISGEYGNKDIPPRDNVTDMMAKANQKLHKLYASSEWLLGYTSQVNKKAYHILHLMNKFIDLYINKFTTDILYEYKDLSFINKAKDERVIVIDSLAYLFGNSNNSLFTKNETIVATESHRAMEKLCKHIFGDLGYNIFITDSYGNYMRHMLRSTIAIARGFSFRAPAIESLVSPPIYTTYDIFIKDDELKTCNTTPAEIKNLRSRYNPITMKHDYFIEMDSGITINNCYSGVIIAYEGVEKQEIKYEFNNYIRHDNILNYNKVSPYLNYIKRLMK